MIQRQFISGASGALLALGILLFSGTHTLMAAPSADLWPRWQVHDKTSTTEVDHGIWNGLLQKFVSRGDDGINRVSYARFTDTHRRVLAGYLNDLSAVRVSGLNRAEQRAYWVNLYNALTVQVILDAGPVDSIRDIDISSGLFSDGPWNKALITIEGEAVTLDDIEHRILRSLWQDPRLHYVLNCASLGCPDLQTTAMTGANGEEYLNQAATQFINHPRGVTIEDDKAKISRIYDWFSEDFGGSDADLLNHLKAHASQNLAVTLENVTKISFQDYDWGLNATTTPVLP